MKRVVFMKQSGESLAGSDGAVYDDEAIHDAAVRIQLAHEARGDLGIDGLTIVSGGGNIMRGGANASPIRDGVGRLATVTNTLMLQDALENLGVPVSTFISPGTLLYDKASDINPRDYRPGHMIMVHERGDVALLGGGMGINGQTTDAAVVQCAADYAAFYRRVEPSIPLQPTILKSTRYDGIYDVDPAVYGESAPRYRRIGAPHMLNNYEQFAALDRPSLEALVAHQLGMTVFSGSHSLVDVLQEDYAAMTGKGIGTHIVANDIPPVLYETY